MTARSITYRWGRTNRVQSTRNGEEQLATDLVITIENPQAPASSGSNIYTTSKLDANAVLIALRAGELSAPVNSGPLVIAEGSNVFDGASNVPIGIPAGVVGGIQIEEERDAPQGRIYRVTVTTALHADRSSLQPASVTYSMQAGAVEVQAFRVDSEDTALLKPTDEGWAQIGSTLLYKITPGAWYDSSVGMNAAATVTGDPVQRDASGAEVGTARPAGDIGGQYVDWSGKPIQFPLAVTTHTVAVVRDAPYLALTGTTPSTAYDHGDQTTIQSHQAFVGKRNTEDLFRTGDKGRLMLKAVSMEPLGTESQRVTYTFVEHPWSHAIQVPRQTFGSGFFAMKYLGDPRLIQHTVGVYWQQPHQYGANFASAGVVFTAAELRVISELYDDANP